MRPKRQKNRIFRSFLLSNILIMILPLISGILFQQITFDVIRNEMYNSNLTVMRNTGNSIDKVVEEIGNIISRVALDDSLHDFINMPPLQEGSPDIKIVNEAYEKLSDLKLQLTNRYIIDLAIYSNINKLVVSSRVAYSKQPYYYKSILNFGNLDFAEWESLFLARKHNLDTIPSTPITFYGTGYNALTFLQSMPYGYFSTEKGTLFAFLDADQLMDMLKPLKNSESSLIMVLDETGQTLMQLGDDSSFDVLEMINEPDSEYGYRRLKDTTGSYLVTYYRSTINRWMYVAIQPEAVIDQKLAGTRRLILLLASVTMIISFLITLVLSWKRSSPINRIYRHSVEDIPGNLQNSKINPIEMIDRSISRLVADRQEIRMKLDSQKSLLRQSFLRQLLNNELSGEQEISRYAQNLEINLDFQTYLCAILAASSQTGNSAEDFDDLMHKHFSAAFPESFLINRGFKSYTMIYCSRLAETDQVRQEFSTRLDQFCDSVKWSALGELTVDIGFAVQLASDCFQSYQSALSVHEERRFKELPQVIWYCDQSVGGGQYRFSLDNEYQLASMVREGKTANASREIARLLQENLEHRDLTSHDYRQFLQLLWLTAVRLNQELDEKDRIDLPQSLDLTGNKHTVAAQIQRWYDQLTDIFHQKDEKEYKRFRTQFTDYVEEHYHDPMLNLAQLADEFGILESTAYLYFKKQMNITFADYLEQVRIQHACEILLNEAGPVVDVAERVGYNSPHSFRRAFKRIKGVTPSIYKELLQDIGKLGRG